MDDLLRDSPFVMAKFNRLSRTEQGNALPIANLFEVLQAMKVELCKTEAEVVDYFARWA
jgi:hypothetical protein